jgi:hypothetical protein
MYYNEEKRLTPGRIVTYTYRNHRFTFPTADTKMSTALVPSGGAGGASFTQQGSVDWISLAQGTATWSIGVLSRFSAAGVDPYTTIAAQVVCKANFQLSHSGRRNVNSALSKLTAFKSFGDALWFGFGTKHLVRTLATTEEGTLVVALCGALAEMYTENARAEILGAIARTTNVPEEFTPSLLQWRDLCNACAGVFADTPFPLRLNTFARLMPDAAVSMSPADPDSLTEVLLAIGSIARGALAAITVSGAGHQLAFLAAVSEWLFGLNITIENNFGQRLYTNHADNVTTQVTFIYSAVSPPPGLSQTALISLNPVYKLECGARLVRFTDIGSHGRTTLSESRLGKTLCRLVNTDGDFIAAAIGNAARIYEGLVSGEWPKRNCYWDSYFDDSYGVGFIEKITRLFPCLSELEEKIWLGFKVPAETALMSYDELFFPRENANIVDCCREFAPSGCVKHITGFAIILTHLMAGLKISSDLHPTVLGLELFFHRFCGGGERLNFDESASFLGYGGRPKLIDHVLFGLKLHSGCSFVSDYCWFRQQPGNRWKKYRRPTLRQVRQIRLEAVSCLFGIKETTRPNQQRDNSTIAVSDSGICVFRQSLCGLTDDSQECGLIHVVAGGVEHRGKPYPRVFNRSWTAERISEPSPNVASQSLKVKVEIDCLRVWYELNTRHLWLNTALAFGPAKWEETVIEARRILSCGHPKSSKTQCYPAENICLPGIDISIRTVDGFPRLVELLKVLDAAVDDVGFVLFRDHSCDQCFIKAASVRKEWEDFGGRMVLLIN